MIKPNDIKDAIIKLFPADVLKDTTWEYGFKCDFDRDVKVIAYATNLTPFTINCAIDAGADMLITHHDAWPFMNAQREHCHKMLIDNKINHCFVHTPLDAAEFGTSSSLARDLGVFDTKKTAEYFGHLCGVAGKISEQSFEQFVQNCERVLGEKVRSFKNNNNPVSRVLVVTGGGNETKNLDNAIAENCDTYITGEYGMYLQHYAQFHNINLVIGSHTKTEIIGVRNFVKEILKGFENIKAVEIDEPEY